MIDLIWLKWYIFDRAHAGHLVHHRYHNCLVIVIRCALVVSALVRWPDIESLFQSPKNVESCVSGQKGSQNARISRNINCGAWAAHCFQAEDPL